MMKNILKIDTELKRRCLIYGSLAALLIAFFAYLLIAKIFSFYVLWGMFVVLPILIAVDICYVTLPITLICTFILSLYTLITKDYQKFNWLYECLLIMIIAGLFNFHIETLLNNRSYVTDTYHLKLYWSIITEICCILSVMFLSRFKDNRMYLLTYILLLLFYLSYLILNMLE